MPTLRFAHAEDLSAERRAVLERVAKRMGRAPDELGEIFRAQAHWPEYLEANHVQTLYGFGIKGELPELTKQAMHVAVSMANRCEY
jgi:alkylhydroperoxidase family enzyme